ncbi:MAG: ATP-binding protein [Bacteroidales bacterium]|nr:ATP-binding protein [Bacteroidales bacterium]
MMKGIPYGVTDYDRIVNKNFYYVDKTDFIPLLEKSDSFFTYLRPRRFGKTLFLATLDAYYNVKYKDNFDLYFKDKKIYQELTEEHSSYLILKFDFSKVDNKIEKVYDSFNDIVIEYLRFYITEYSNLLPNETLENFNKIKNCDRALDYVLMQTKIANKKVYLIIDEYDNFANSLLSRNEDEYISLTHGDGFFRLFFNIIKAHTSGNFSPIERIFITGVSPLTLSDVTSGYNIGGNHSFDEEFNNMVGFTETEVREILEYYEKETGVFKHSVDEILNIIKPYYNNYCFNEYCLEVDRVFNTDMFWYFLKNYIKHGEFPKEMVDKNISTDYDKMRMLIRYDKNFGHKASVIQQLMINEEIETVVNPEFTISELTSDNNLVSLLIYLGMLAMDRYEMGATIYRIPNYTVKSQYYRYMTDCYKDCISWRSDDDLLNSLGRKMAYRGEALEFIDYLLSCMTDLSSNRDFDPMAESFVKGFLLANLGVKMNFYTIETEKEANHGYSDIKITPRLDAKHAFVIELKYLKKDASDNEVKEQEKQAEIQLRQYLNDKIDKIKHADNEITCRGIVCVVRGYKKEVLKYID